MGKKLKKTEKKICYGRCRKEYPLDKFYNADETLYPDGKLHLCKNCVKQLIDEKGFDAVLLILRAMNKPFLQSIWNGNWNNYIKMISSLHQYKNLTFNDSEFTGDVIKFIPKVKVVEGDIDEFDDLDDIEQYEEKWGKGFTLEEYRFLENEYHKLTTHYKCDSYAMEILFQEIAQLRLTIKKSRESNKSVEKELKLLQDLLGSANIKPAQESGANAPEQATFGTLIKKFENERPIPEPDEAWKDVDGIRRYINIWFFGHLCRMLGIKNDFYKEYEKEINKYKVELNEIQEDEENIGEL